MSRRQRSSAGDLARGRISSSGNVYETASKLPKVTPLRSSKKFSTGIPSSTVRASASKRTSYMGVSDHHMKDTRPIGDKQYMRKCIVEIVNFISDLGAPFALTPKMMMPPTNRDYFRVFEFIFQQFKPSFCLGKPEAEEVTRIYRDLGYPYNLPKSTWSNVGTMSAWPHALGALDWLVDLLKYKISVENNELSSMVSTNDKIKDMKYDYLKRCYVEFMNGKDEPYEELDMEFNKIIDNISLDKNKELDELTRENQLLDEELEALLAEQEEANLIEVQHSETIQTNNALEDYIVQMQDYCGKLEEKREKAESETNELSEKISDVEKDIIRLKSIISQQDLSMADIQMLEVEKQQLTSGIEAMQSRKQKVEGECWEKEIGRTKIVEKINDQVADCNEICQKLNLASMSDQSDFLLSLGHAGIASNATKLSTHIQPTMLKHASDSLEKVGKLHQHRNQLSTRIDQIKEQILDKTDRKESMTAELESSTGEYAKKENDINTQEDQLKREIESNREDLEMLKTVNENSLEDATAALDSVELKLKKLKDKCSMEVEERTEGLLELCEIAVKHREKCDEKIDEFVKHMEENEQKRKQIDTASKELNNKIKMFGKKMNSNDSSK